MLYVKVVLDIPSKQLNQTFDYYVPSYIKGVSLGSRVLVDFNNVKRLAYVVGKMSASKEAIKPILLHLDKKPLLSKLQLELVDYIKEGSFTSYKKAFETVIPSALHAKIDYLYTINDASKVPSSLAAFIKKDVLQMDVFGEEDYSILNGLIEEGVIEKKVFISKMNPKYEKELFIKKEHINPTKAQKAILKRLDAPTLMETLIKEGYSKNSINTLIKKKVIGYKDVIKVRSYTQDYTHEIEKPPLREEQIKAVETLKEEYKRYLLFGPPGSGKTEVYLQLIEAVLNKGKQVLVLVPEIGLIPLMVARLQNRFEEEIAVYHSGLSKRVRYDMYVKIKEKMVNIIVGVRSAIFTPSDNVGMIIIDECHDASYIQKTLPYYQTSEIANYIGKSLNIPIIYGTATPSVSLRYDADMGLYELMKLTHTPQTTEIALIDMKQELKEGNLSLFSKDLKQALTKTIANKKQAIILVNRRGYAPFMMCRSCGDVRKCPTCEVSLTFHKSSNTLKCHHCGYEESHEKICKSCKSHKLKSVGFGIEQVYESLCQEFSDIRVLRMDADTLKEKTHDAILTQFKDQKADVLIGTQMVSKGHHFENVDLVCVMLADQMLKLNSYLANESTFQLLYQHIGRIRRKDGRAIIQAYDINHFVLKSLKKYDYNLFYNQEIALRKISKYPPYYQMVTLTLKGVNPETTYQELNKVKLRILARNSHFSILGPIVSFIPYYKGRHQYELTIKVPRHVSIRNLLSFIEEKLSKEYYIDIDNYPNMV